MNQNSRNSQIRILDAARNRATEGIRVVEDVARMHLGDPFLAKQLKQLRHRLVESLAIVSSSSDIKSRDSIGDVGRHLQTDSEYQRGDRLGNLSEVESANGAGTDKDGLVSVVQANLKRTQQAVRSIEEIVKLIDIKVAKTVEQIRYDAYTIEKAVLTSMLSRAAFPSPSIYALVDGCGGDESKLEKIVRSLIHSGVDFIQLRDKSMTDRELIAAGHLIRKLTKAADGRFIMNDRADLAMATDADGVHVGQEEMPAADVRKIVGSKKLIGVSTHSLEQAKAAVLEGADYIGVGPVFTSQTKTFDQYVGVEMLREVVSEVSLPAFAIGGVGPDNVAEVAAAGCSRVAVTWAFESLYGQPEGAYLDVEQRMQAVLAAAAIR